MFDKREMLLEAICKIFSNGAVAYGQEIIQNYIFFNDAAVNAGKICFVHLRERQAQLLNSILGNFEQLVLLLCSVYLEC